MELQFLWIIIAIVIVSAIVGSLLRGVFGFETEVTAIEEPDESLWGEEWRKNYEANVSDELIGYKDHNMGYYQIPKNN